MHPYAVIERISIMKTARVAVAHHDGRKVVHGLGDVGEPIGPYLGDRASQHYGLAFPADCRDLTIWEVDYNAEPTASGRYPRRRVGWAGLSAPDYPTAVSAGGAR